MSGAEDPKKQCQREARIAAMDLLARREHSRRELVSKLERRFVPDVVAATVDTLADEGLQSDQRFAEAYLRQRSERGYGPLRIRQEMRQRGVSDQLITEAEAACEVDWYALLERVAKRKFGDAEPADLSEKAKRQRFLMYRGFSTEQIRDVLD